MENFKDAKRVVIKVGTSTLTHDTGLINIRRIEALVKVLADLANSGKEIVLVTSGAIGVGLGKMGIRKRPEDIPSKQAAAAVGQCELMYIYDNLFSGYNHTVAQILLTKDIITQEHPRQNVTNTFKRLLELHVIPIVNENDTVSFDEIVIGDNDTLSAVVAQLIDADALIILSDIDGLYTDNPRTNPDAALISRVEQIDANVHAMASGVGSSRGTGGMVTKVHAAEMATQAGIDMAIVCGEDPEILYRLFEGKTAGTHFVAQN